MKIKSVNQKDENKNVNMKDKCKSLINSYN